MQVSTRRVTIGKWRDNGTADSYFLLESVNAKDQIRSSTGPRKGKDGTSQMGLACWRIHDELREREESRAPSERSAKSMRAVSCLKESSQ